MANNVIVRNVSSDGQLQDGSYFENAATNEVLEEVGTFIKTGHRDQEKRDRQRERSENKRHNEDQDNNKKNLNEQNKSTWGFFDNLGKVVSELGSIGLRAYKMEVDVGEDVKGAINAVSSLSKGIIGAIGTVGGGALNLAVKGFGKMLGTTTKKLDLFSGIGEKFDELLGPLGKAIDGGVDELVKYHAAVRDAAEVGAGFNNELLEFKAASAMARMSLSDFGQMIRYESKEFAGFGTTISDGVKQFAMTVDEFADSGGMAELKQLGFTTEQVTKMIRRQMTMQRRRDFDDAAVREEEMGRAKAYAKQLDALARLSGEERKELQKRVDDRRREAENDATIRQLDRDGSKGVAQAFKTLMGTVGQFGEGAEKAFQEIFQHGVVYTEEGMAAMSALGSAGDEVMQAALRARQGGDVSDVAIDVGGAIIKRINENDFLAMAKLAPFGNEVARQAANTLTAGGGIYDALVKVGKDIPVYLTDAMANDLFAEAMEQIAKDQKEQIEEQGKSVGTGINSVLNNLETGMQNIGASMNERMVDFTNNLQLGDIAVSRSLASLSQTIADGTDGISQFISPESRLFQTYDEETKLRNKAIQDLKKSADASIAQKEEADKKLALKKEAEEKRHKEIMSANPFEHQRTLVEEQNKEQKKLTTQIKSDLEIVTDKLTKFTDDAFAKIGVDSAAIREDMKTAMGTWKEDSKQWLMEHGFDVEKFDKNIVQPIVTALGWLKDAMTSLSSTILEYMGFDVDKIKEKLGEAWDNANADLGNAYFEGKQGFQNVIESDFVTQVKEATVTGLTNGFDRLVALKDDIFGDDSEPAAPAAPAAELPTTATTAPKVTEIQEEVPVSITSVAPSVPSLQYSITPTKEEAKSGGKKISEKEQQTQYEFEQLFEETKATNTSLNTFVQQQYSILEELKKLNTTTEHGNSISDYQARQQTQTNNRLGGLKPNRNDIHAVLQ